MELEGSSKRCCVPNCDATRNLHTFPNPAKQKDRFTAWIRAIGKEDKWSVNCQKVHKIRRLCHAHFESKYFTHSNRLNVDAVPTLLLPEIPGMEPNLDFKAQDYSPDFSTVEESNSNTELLEESPTTSVEYGPDINQDVASSFEHIALTGLDDETRNTLIKKHPIPNNCTTIHAPSLTPEVKSTITEQVLKQDEAIEAKQRQLAAAISLLGRIISDQLLNTDTNNSDLVKQLIGMGHLLCDLQYLESLERYKNINSSESDVSPEIGGNMQDIKTEIDHEVMSNQK